MSRLLGLNIRTAPGLRSQLKHLVDHAALLCSALTTTATYSLLCSHHNNGKIRPADACGQADSNAGTESRGQTYSAPATLTCCRNAPRTCQVLATQAASELKQAASPHKTWDKACRATGAWIATHLCGCVHKLALLLLDASIQRRPPLHKWPLNERLPILVQAVERIQAHLRQ